MKATRREPRWILTSEDRLDSGVPLGGIGAGKLEITPKGLFTGFTFLNNWSQPLGGTPIYPGILGFHFAVRAGRSAALLQTVPVLDLPVWKKLRYEGLFPRARIIFEEPAWDLDGSLEAFSPWLPGDVKHSSLPACLFRLTLANRGRSPMDAGFLFIGRNICGEWCVGRKNRLEQNTAALTLEFSNPDRANVDPRQGQIAFTFLKKGWEWSSMESWNAVRRNFSFDPQNLSLPAWEHFAKEGRLPDTRADSAAQGENQELCSAAAASRVLAPGQSASIDFAASWYFPNHAFGHRYEKWFSSARGVSLYALKKKPALERKVQKIERVVRSFPFPQWFNEALLTNLSPFFSSSWFTRDGRFAFYEAPQTCPLMGTIDVGFYGSIPLSYFFPELEKSQLLQFAAAQRADGYVPHDLGKSRLDRPSNGTTYYFWKDLNLKFALMAWRDFLWGGQDKKFLKAIYPHVRKAVRWSFQTDHNGDGLPDHEGADQTFDLWAFKGAHPYTSSLFLAALLACQKMAQFVGDKTFARECREAFARGRRSFEKSFWNGEYFGSAESCALSQLNGQWYADLLGLGSIADPAKIRKALNFMLNHNSCHSSYGMVNSVTADGRLDTSNEHARNIWSGMNYAFASLCVLRGFALSPLLKQIHKIWDNVTRVQKSPWSQPDTIDSKNGRYVFGDSYYRNMAIWSVPIAYSMKDPKTAKHLRLIRNSSGL